MTIAAILALIVKLEPSIASLIVTITKSDGTVQQIASQAGTATAADIAQIQAWLAEHPTP